MDANSKRSNAAATFEDIDTVSQSDVAQTFVDLYFGAFAFDHTRGKWYRWTGKLWELDDTKLALHRAVGLSRHYSANLTGSQRRDCRKSAFAHGVLAIAAAHPELAVTASRWNPNPFLLGTPDGTVDLRTGTIMPPSPSDFIARAVAVVPAEVSDCPRWLAFLSEAFDGNPAMIRFVQQWCGYSLTGSTREQKFAFLYGPGGNGKGTLLGTISAIASDYFTEAPIETFLASAHDRHPTELAMLEGARLVSATETDQGRTWNEQRLKALTGGDTISARFMRGDFFSFKPQFSLTFQGNHMPELKAVGDAMCRRLILVPMLHKPARANLSLADNLVAEWPGILRWMLDGCLDWQRNGLVIPDDVNAATRDYFAEQDTFNVWAEERCDVQPNNLYLYDTATRLFGSWQAFMKRNGLGSGSLKSFSEELERKGFPLVRKNSERRRIGIRLKALEGERYGDE
ncbi:putative DNA primase/helicase [Rhizobium sp. BK313]|uniref:phage/plasmid primase, P4 family n=1 Tax=Rhizobium sp. BK313 TaxID=2587081 RepID=UPI00105F3936|nr:phage/plasmid primase, P4 family [Rhizobium sp. BK313]MBB3455210.1 putative DNA primase/helicase [Rhizobium sp. BK313]